MAPDSFLINREKKRLTVGEQTYLVADPLMEQRMALVRQLAGTQLPVLIHGETGVGKEHVAYAVHHWSRRAQLPFVVVNCAAIQDTLIESELFGHRKGAFTGAVADKKGLIEAASGGTLFLDEVGELSQSAQAKLLRVTDRGRLTRLGEVTERTVDLRIVAATNRDLAAEVKAGRFRLDLYYRLSTATVLLPPLRERPSEVVHLANEFLSEALASVGRPPVVLPDEAAAALLEHDWPGNVRELKNLMCLIAATTHELGFMAGQIRAHLNAPRQSPGPTSEQPRVFRALSEEIAALERLRIAEALEAARGIQCEAARLLGVPIRTFTAKLRKHGLGRRRAGVRALTAIDGGLA